MNMRMSWFNLMAFCFLSFMLSSFLEPVNKGDVNIEGASDTIPQTIQPVDLKSEFNFAGEKLPLDNFDVRERLDREMHVNTFWQSSTILNIKNAAKYFPVIEKILEEQGVPQDFKYLAVAESALRNAVSPSGARGIWQFLRSSAREKGLEVNSDIDERYNIELATRAACEYLKENYDRFGSWTLAAAAYNTGPTRLAREMENQKEDSYYDLNLSEETMRYVFRIVALKEIMTHPDDYGYRIDHEDIYPPLKDYTIMDVDYQIDDLADFAHDNGTSYRLLKVFNPWLRTSRLPNQSRKLYYIKIPEDI
ncbi:MAG: lytic transglycosylase domain-containing protein [Saprospiraceae bacterium]|nr:lytic transglycosylase domain-containing protein [Saprospiraceae bacterium]